MKRLALLIAATLSIAAPGVVDAKTHRDPKVPKHFQPTHPLRLDGQEIRRLPRLRPRPHQAALQGWCRFDQ
jgi:hypothetical protein